MSRQPGLSASGRCRECGKPQVRFETNGMGRLVEVPAPCGCVERAQREIRVVARTPAWRQRIDNDRRRACICQLCDEPVTGKPKVALYCDTHRAERRKETQVENRKAKMREYSRRYRERNREKVRRKERARARRERKQRAEYKRAWRRLNRDKTRAQKQRHALRNFRDPSRSARLWREKVAAGEHAPTPERRNESGDRLCLTPTCPEVVTGRVKLCDGCKYQLAREAAEQLRARAA